MPVLQTKMKTLRIVLNVRDNFWNKNLSTIYVIGTIEFKPIFF